MRSSIFPCRTACQFVSQVAFAFVLLVATPLLAQQPQLIPQPREMQTLPNAFHVTSDLAIVLISPLAAEDRFAAETLQEELRFATGQHFAINVAPELPAGKRTILLGRFDQPVVRSLLEQRHIKTDDVGEQGYVLDVTPEQAVMAGKDGAGLFYGAQTLRQLVVGEGPETEILGVRVRDWPSLLFRGAQVDMSRGPVPKLEYLKRIVRTLAEFKMNQLYMYIEDSFRLNGQPLVGVLSDTLTRADWEHLVAFARPYHLEIIPATEACGHLHKILRFELYSGIAERPHGHVLAAGDPHALSFLDQMYSQLATVFPASTYNIGCDETEELGKGRSAPLVAQQGYGRVYVDNLIQVAKLVQRYNKQVMFWGDIAVEHPEMIPSLPKDLIVASWEYGAHPNYDKWLKPFTGSGMKIFVCPWAGNTSLVIPDYEEAAANIQTFLSDGKKAGAIGTDVTVWNDDGESLYGPNWWSIVYGAACAWEPSQTSVPDFDRKFDWAFYRNTDHRFTEALKKLGHLNEVLRAGAPVDTYDEKWGGAWDSSFWQQPFSPEGQKDSQKALPVAELLRHTAEESYTVFTESASHARHNRDTLADLEFAALKLDALGMRYQYAQEISQLYADALAHEHDKDQEIVGSDLSNITSTNGRLEDLRDYTTRLTELYRELWLNENLPTWLPNILLRYHRDNEMWEEQIRRFNQISAEHWQGKSMPPADSLGLLPVTPTSNPHITP